MPTTEFIVASKNCNYLVVSSAANMPSSCWGRYRRVAVVKVEPGIKSIAAISERTRGVIEVVATREKCNVGRTARGAYQQAVIELQAYANDLAMQASR